MPSSVAPHSKNTPQERDEVQRIGALVDAFENSMGVDIREKFTHRYKLYRGFKKFRNAWEAAGPNDRDGVVYDAKKTWGANLHIPYAFSTVETMLPRAIAQRPRMLVLPRDERWERNVDPVRMTIDAQQEAIDIELAFQDVMRDGFIYGLGASKTFWRKEWARRRVAKKRVFGGGWVLGKAQSTLVFDDPDYEPVDVFDLMWDQYGYDVQSSDWMVHRLWMSLPKALDRIASGAWNTQAARSLTEDEIRSMGSNVKYDEVWADRLEASGFAHAAAMPRGEQIHELWEFHDGERVLTVLDRQVLVQDGENPQFGMLPFQIYRPTPVSKQMVGIGEIEPIESLQRELDTLRSQRRDAATIALCAGYAYDDGAIDETDLVFGPAAAIPVRNARPADAIMPLPVRDVPGSSWQEEAALKSDIERVTGVNDALAGGDGGSIGTATEAQLVQASLSKRVELKSRRFEVENVRPAARAFLALNQRMILTDRQMQQAIPPDEDPITQGTTKRYLWFDVGPGELMGEYEVMPEGGAMAAENMPQKRQDAQMLWAQFRDHPDVNQRELLLRVLELSGVKRPESMLNQSEAPVPPEMLEVLARMLGPSGPDMVQRAVAIAQQQSPQIPAPQGAAGGAQPEGQQEMQQIEGGAR